MRPVLTFNKMFLSYRSAKVFYLENFPLYGILGALPQENLGCRKRLYAFLPSSHGLGYEATVLHTLGIQARPFLGSSPSIKEPGYEAKS